MTSGGLPPRRSLGCSSLSEYNIINQVGEGTFGEVHKGESKVTGELVALKRLRIEKETEGFPITAIREIRLLKQLSHANVVSLLDMAVKKSSGKPMEVYMVFPYMEHDLSGLIDNSRVKFETAQIKAYAKQLFEGLNYLHANHILHRDLKCANILINNKGVLKIADFGLARHYDPEERRPMTHFVVTRWYRPPELLLGQTRYTAAIDIWGAGCIVAEMIKRKPLFPGVSEIDQLDQIFTICGSPNDDVWPGWRDLLTSSPVQQFKAYHRNVKPTMKVFFEPMPPDQLMLDLMDALLVLCPESRPTAEQALQHIWFTSHPFPMEPSRIPQIREDCHEFEVRKFRETMRRSVPPQQQRPAPASNMNVNMNMGMNMNKPNPQFCNSQGHQHPQPVNQRPLQNHHLNPPPQRSQSRQSAPLGSSRGGTGNHHGQGPSHHGGGPGGHHPLPPRPPGRASISHGPRRDRDRPGGSHTWDHERERNFDRDNRSRP